ncbi:MAG: CopG family antitoxin [Euryarchaeota archaeon]|nr:CopG family antitoxin [Euryarchaeota archaeon]
MNANKRKNGISERFSSAEEAGEFWDSHSTADYGDELEEEDMEFEIEKHTFMVPVNAQIYRLAEKQAEARHSTVEQIINTLLDRELVKTDQ